MNRLHELWANFELQVVPWKVTATRLWRGAGQTKSLAISRQNKVDVPAADLLDRYLVCEAFLRVRAAAENRAAHTAAVAAAALGSCPVVNGKLHTDLSRKAISTIAALSKPPVKAKPTFWAY